MMRLTAPLVALIALSTACTGGSDERSGPPRPGDPVPDFRGVTLEGDSLSLDALRGEVILVNLWATWCLPCRTETPFLQSVHEQYRTRGLRLVGVSLDSRSARPDVDRFLGEMGVTYEIVHDAAGMSMDLFSAVGLPATYLVDREGRIRFSRLGPVSEDDPEFWNALNDALS